MLSDYRTPWTSHPCCAGFHTNLWLPFIVHTGQSIVIVQPRSKFQSLRYDHITPSNCSTWIFKGWELPPQTQWLRSVAEPSGYGRLSWKIMRAKVHWRSAFSELSTALAPPCATNRALKVCTDWASCIHWKYLKVVGWNRHRKNHHGIMTNKTLLTPFQHSWPISLQRNSITQRRRLLHFFMNLTPTLPWEGSPSSKARLPPFVWKECSNINILHCPFWLVQPLHHAGWLFHESHHPSPCLHSRSMSYLGQHSRPWCGTPVVVQPPPPWLSRDTKINIHI